MGLTSFNGRWTRCPTPDPYTFDNVVLQDADSLYGDRHDVAFLEGELRRRHYGGAGQDRRQIGDEVVSSEASPQAPRNSWPSGKLTCCRSTPPRRPAAIEQLIPRSVGLMSSAVIKHGPIEQHLSNILACGRYSGFSPSMERLLMSFPIV